MQSYYFIFNKLETGNNFIYSLFKKKLRFLSKSLLGQLKPKHMINFCPTTTFNHAKIMSLRKLE